MFLLPARRKAQQAAVAPFNRFEHMLDEVFAGFPAFEAAGGALLPKTDVTENDKAVTLNIELPGVSSDDVKLSLQNDVLTIRAEKKSEKVEHDDRVHRVERSFGVFERRFDVSNGIDVDGIEASQEDGVLTVVLPKSERAKGREIKVK